MAEKINPLSLQLIPLHHRLPILFCGCFSETISIKSTARLASFIT